MTSAAGRRRRRRRESPQARAACLLYLRQGNDRSLDRVAAELGYRSTSRVEYWSVRYQWRERLLLWTKDPDDFEARFAATGGRHLWPGSVTGRQGRPDSPQAWEAWLIYLGQGEFRSYAAVADTLGKSRSLIARWGKRHRWPERIQNAERRAEEPDEEPWPEIPFDDELFERGLGVLELRLPESQPPPYEPAKTRAELHRRIAKTLQPWLSEAPSDRPSFPKQLRLVSPNVLEKVNEIDRLSLARTVRESVAFIKPIVARSQTDEPLWHEEVIEHLEALQALTHLSREPLTGPEEDAARGLLSRLEMVGRQFNHNWFGQPQALEDMLALLAPLFDSLDKHSVSHEADPHLRHLTRLLALLPGTTAAARRETHAPPAR